MKPVQVYRIAEERPGQSRFDVAATKGLTPLVGRELEVEFLLERWAQVETGCGQVILLSGEAGIGKSRLAQVLKTHLTGDRHARMEMRCSPYNQHSALHPVIQHLHRLLQWRHADGPQENLHKLEEALAWYGLSLPDHVPLFAALLALPLPDRYAPPALTPQRQRQKTLEALLVWLLQEAQRQPVLLIVEDLQWIDPSTLELLNLVIDQGATAPILTLLTYRPEFRPPWGSRPHLTQVTLTRLPRPQVQVMVERVAGGKMLPAEVVQQVMAQTDGVPLFVEELTKMVLESEWFQQWEAHRGEATGWSPHPGPLPPLDIPTTLSDVLMARLDQLTTAKGVAQLGATLGRTFTYELLQAVSPMDEITLRRELEKLVEAELLYQRGILPQVRYVFKHALIQEAAYQSLLKRTRQQYHQRIAQVLEKRFPETAATQPELLAHHYTAAGLYESALPYWRQAGLRAAERSAHAEALKHLTSGLQVLTHLPDTPARPLQELALQIALGRSLMATQGYGAPDVGRAYVRARDLCQQLGQPSQLFSVLRGLWAFSYVRAEFQTAQELGEQCLTLAQQVQDPHLLLRAHQTLGTTLYFLGAFAAARTHLEQGIALYHAQQHLTPSIPTVQDPGVTSLSLLGLQLWYLGYPDQALQRCAEAVSLARALSHPFSLAESLFFAGVVSLLRRDVAAVREHLAAVVTLSTEHGFPHWVVLATILQGWVRTLHGQGEEGIAQMRHGLDSWRAIRGEAARPWLLALLAEAYGTVGRWEAGLTVVAEALALAHQTGERQAEAELFRLQGALRWQQGGGGEAEASFQQALDVARRQQAKALELRAAIALSRLWQRHGKGDEARQLLADLYGWFTEGFATADLQEAQTLLADL